MFLNKNEPPREVVLADQPPGGFVPSYPLHQWSLGCAFAKPFLWLGGVGDL
jgi:hypothetical protein